MGSNNNSEEKWGQRIILKNKKYGNYIYGEIKIRSNSIQNN